MSHEIERKFLVMNDSWREDVIRRIPMRQGYLHADKRMTLRVRAAGETAWLTLKSAREGISRLEYEYVIPLADACEMLDTLAEGGIIVKTRHIVPYADHTWEVDVFEGENEGLIVAEIELDSSEETFDKPSWAGDEVTQESRYLNSNLSRHPYRRW